MFIVRRSLHFLRRLWGHRFVAPVVPSFQITKSTAVIYGVDKPKKLCTTLILTCFSSGCPNQSRRLLFFAPVRIQVVMFTLRVPSLRTMPSTDPCPMSTATCWQQRKGTRVIGTDRWVHGENYLVLKTFPFPLFPFRISLRSDVFTHIPNNCRSYSTLRHAACSPVSPKRVLRAMHYADGFFSPVSDRHETHFLMPRC